MATVSAVPAALEFDSTSRYALDRGRVSDAEFDLLMKRFDIFPEAPAAEAVETVAAPILKAEAQKKPSRRRVHRAQVTKAAQAVCHASGLKMMRVWVNFVLVLVREGVNAMQGGGFQAKDTRSVREVIEGNLVTLSKRITKRAGKILKKYRLIETKANIPFLVETANMYYTEKFLDIIKGFREQQIATPEFIACRSGSFALIDSYSLSVKNRAFLKKMYDTMAKSYPTDGKYQTIAQWKAGFDRQVSRMVEAQAKQYAVVLEGSSK